MEKFWLVLAIASFIVVAYLFIADGINRENLQYLVFPTMAGAMYAFRLFVRKRMEHRNDR